MILFDQLRISDDGKRMYLNFHVNTADYFKDLYLDSLTIIPADKVLETDPNVPSENYIYKKEYEDDTQEDALVLLPTDMNEEYMKTDFTKDLFFVYVKVKGTPDSCTTCRLDEEITLGVTFDTTMLYQMIMQQTRQLADTCNIAQDFIDLILLWNGFKAAVETEHYVVAIDFWKKLFSGKSTIIPFKSCGCHG